MDDVWTWIMWNDIKNDGVQIVGEIYYSNNPHIYYSSSICNCCAIPLTIKSFIGICIDVRRIILDCIFSRMSFIQIIADGEWCRVDEITIITEDIRSFILILGGRRRVIIFHLGFKTDFSSRLKINGKINILDLLPPTS